MYLIHRKGVWTNRKTNKDSIIPIICDFPRHEPVTLHIVRR